MAKIDKNDKVGGNNFGKFVSSLAKFDPHKVGQTVKNLNPATATNEELKRVYSQLLLLG